MTEKMLGRARLILLAAMPLLLSLCSRTEELLPDTSPSDKKTVTITVRSSETIAGQGTKTTLGQDGRVIWNEGDYVSVNNQRFPVIPDPDDPTMATVEGVPESPEYVAWVGNGYFYDTYWSLTFDYYIGYEQSRKNMPMVAYSTDTNLEFKNIGGVVRLGVTGTQTLNTINLVTNDGSTIAGMLNVPVDDFVSGELKDSYGEPENLSGNGTVSSIEFYYDSEDEFVTLSPSSPEYFDFCIPSRVYEGGFTVILDDIDGNVAVKKVSSPVEVLRSTIVPMQTFAFEPVPEPDIEVTETTDSTISFTVTAEPGMGIRAGVLYSSLYETLPEKEGYFDDDWETRDDYAETAIYESEDGYKTTGEDGTCEFRFSKVCNDEGWYVKMNAGTGYRIAVSYFIDTENEHLMFGKPVLLETATEEAAGEGPEFEAKLLADTCSYTNMVMQINTFSEVSELRAFVWPQKEYDRYIGNGMTDVEIIQAYGRILDGEMVAEAAGDGLVLGSTDIRSCLVYPSENFLALIMATGPDGAASVRAVQYAAPEHFAEEPVWESLSDEAEMRFSFFSDDGSIASDVIFSGLTVEKCADANIFRVAYEPESNPEFAAAMKDCGLESEGRGTCMLYIDATECDYTGSAVGNYLMRVFPEESFTGFATLEGEPVYIATHRNSKSYFPNYSDGYVPDFMNIWVSPYFTSDITDESAKIMSCNINISFPLAGGSSDSGIYTEPFYVTDRTPW